MNQKLSTIVYASYLLLTSCAVAYSPAGGRYASSTDNFTVEVPQRWWQHNLANDRLSDFIEILEKRRKLSWDTLRLTRDGLLLQQIAIGRIPISDELPNSKKKLAADMIPIEAAELVGNDLRSNSNLNHQEIIENAPATLAGYPGFKLHYAYRTADELKIEGLFYGAIIGTWLYYILYEAPAQHYFRQDLQLFESTLSSFELLKGSG